MSNFSLFQQKLLEEDYYPKVNAYYFKHWEAYEMDYHAHKEVEIMYVINGKCTVESLTEALQLKKGDFILLDSNVPHRLIVEAGSPCRMLNIEFTCIPKVSPFPSIKTLAENNSDFTQFLKRRAAYFFLKDPNEIFHTLKNIVLESDKKDEGKEMMLQLLLSQLLLQIARMAVENDELHKKDQQANVYVNQSIEFLHQNYDRDIKINDVAQAVNIHPGYLHRIFKTITHRTIIEYLTNLRMEKAKMLLADTDIPIIEISQYVGVNSSQYFSQIFKKYTKQTPMAYRRSTINNIEKFNRG